jgi:hypothetical protein
MTSQPQKTIYRFIRVPNELTNANGNTVVLIKQQQQQQDSPTVVQKIHNSHHQAVSVKVSTDNVSNEKKMKTRVSAVSGAYV